jgi:hypothetical protein
MWRKMGLSEREIAFGIAVMRQESGFDLNAKNPDKGNTSFGLGQFNPDSEVGFSNRV